MTLVEQLAMTAPASMLYIALEYKNETNMKVAASNINNKTHHLISKQWIPGVLVTIAQSKISRGFTRTCS